jgi:hypothetical protein
MVLTDRSAWAFKFGDRGGSFTDFTPLTASVPRSSAVNSGSRSWIRYRCPVKNPSPSSQRLQATWSIQSLFASMVPPIVLLGDQLPVPGQEGFRRDDGGEFTQKATPDLLGLGCQAPALVIVQAESLVSELCPENSVLFAEIIDGLPLLLAQPTGNRNEISRSRNGSKVRRIGTG